MTAESNITGSPVASAGFPRLSVALISCCALAYEILLLRLFAVIQWHHFAYMVIALALLGYGASGTALSLLREQLLRRFSDAYIGSILLFGLFALLGFMAAEQLSFNPEQLLWNPGHWARLLAVYLLLSVPFFFAANAVGLALMQAAGQVGRVYALDLLGAGGGAVLIVSLLFWMLPTTALLVLVSLGIATAGVAAWELGAGRRWGWLLLPALLPWLLPADWLPLTFSPYKGVSRTLQVQGARLIAQQSSPLGVLSLVENNQIPLRHAPGLSIRSIALPPPQLGLFTDGDALSVINRFDGDRSSVAYLDQMLSALPYHLHRPERALVVGLGGGSGVLQARYFSTEQIDAVELNPDIVELLNGPWRKYSGELLASDQGVRVHIAEGRGFLAETDARYDLISMAAPDAFAGASAGLYALNESYLYTVEALMTYLQRLRPGGYLAVERWVKLPPRDLIKLFATAVRAMQRLGIKNPGQQLVLVRSWQTGILLLKNGEIKDREINKLKDFTRARGFDLAYFPGIQQADTNRFNRLAEPYYYQATIAILDDGVEAFDAGYKFNVLPATDDRPYFFNFFKWQTLPELLALRGQGGAALLESGYLVLIVTLVQAIPVSAVLILLPLLVFRRASSIPIGRPNKARLVGYFAALGLGFLFIEIALIQRTLQLLHHPVYAVSVVLFLVLAFAGLGSWIAARVVTRIGSRRLASAAALTVAVLTFGYLFLLGPLFQTVIGVPVWLKLILICVLIAPLAIMMGMPFPLGLRALAQSAPSLVPWAWGINGCASVIAAICASLLALHAGFSTVLGVAALLYLIASVNFPGRD